MTSILKSASLDYEPPSADLARRLQRFREEALRPLVEYGPAEYTAFRPLLKSIHALGLAGLRYRSDHGGTGEGLRAQGHFAETLGSLPSGGFGMAVTIHYDMVAPLIADFGSEAQRTRFLPPMNEGLLVISHAISEPEAGSDVGGVTTRVRRNGDGWIIEGRKRWISLAHDADYHIVLARVEGGRAPFDTGLFLVPADAAGVRTEPVATMLGNDGCPVGDIVLDAVAIGDDLRVGPAGFGLVNQMRQFAQERIVSSLRATANSRFGLDTILAHARERRIGGEPLSNNPHWALAIAELEAGWYQTRALAWRALATWETGGDIVALSSAAKFASSRLVRRVSELGVQTAGVAGQQRNHPLARLRRDARLYSISTGSDEMMLLSIAKSEKWVR
jgi:citronellyl-CoA dehydrogenase